MCWLTPPRAPSFFGVSRKGERTLAIQKNSIESILDWDQRQNCLTSLTHLEDDGHAFKYLGMYVMVWCSALERGGDEPPFNNVPEVTKEMHHVLKQIADRESEPEAEKEDAGR